MPWSTPEERELEVGVDAVGGQQALDRADQRDLLAARASLAARAVEVGERADELRQRHGVRSLPRERDRARRVAARGLDLREAVERVT